MKNKEGIFGDCDEGQKEQPGCGQRNAKDITQLQEIIRQQAALKQLHISLD